MLGYVMSKIKIKHFCLFIALVIVIIVVLQVSSSLFGNEAKPEIPILLWWTPFLLENRYITCYNEYKCLITTDRKYTEHDNLKALLFYASAFNISDLPIPKTKIWAILHEESPRNAAVFLQKNTFQLFEITSTFSRNSNFPITLQYLEDISIIRDNQYVKELSEKNQLLDSLAPILYIQSDCNTPNQRDKLVTELMKHIPIDSYGDCLKNREFPEEFSKVYPLDLYNERLLEFVSRYKFVIAFENGICQDYITEKLWRPLMVGTVPIYLGSPSIEDWLPNPESAILAKNYQTTEELARYIRKVNENDSLYELHREHKKGKVLNKLLKETLQKGPFGYETDHDNPVAAFECYVCKRIYGDIPTNKKNVYDCEDPVKGSGWEYFWRNGKCQSKILIESVKNNVAVKDECD